METGICVIIVIRATGLGSTKGNGVEPRPTPRTAAHQPLQRQPTAAHRPEARNRLQGVCRTGGLVPAGGRQDRGDQQLVAPDHSPRQCIRQLHLASTLSALENPSPPSVSRYARTRRNAVSRSTTRAVKGRSRVATRPTRTKSCPVLAWTGMIRSAAARRRRRARLRATALPTLRLTVKPTRIAGSFPEIPPSASRACRTKPGAAHFRRDLATRRNSERRFRRATPGDTACSGGEALAALGAPPGQNPAAANGRHTSTESVPALADKLAWLKGAFHAPAPAKFSTAVIRSCPHEVNGSGGRRRDGRGGGKITIPSSVQGGHAMVTGCEDAALLWCGGAGSAARSANARSP